MKYQIVIALLACGLMHASVGAVTFTTNNQFNYEFKYSEQDALTGGVTLAAGYNDNYLHLQEQTESTAFFRFNPHAFIQVSDDNHLFQSYYQLDSRIVSENSDDNYSNQQLLAKYQFSSSLKHRVFVSGEYSTEFEPRGTRISRGKPLSLTEPDELLNTMVNVGYQYGNIESISRLTALVGYRKNEYQTREQETATYNYESYFAVFDGDYSLSSATALRASLEYEEVEYLADDFFNNDQLALFAGMQWKAKDLYKLDVLLGYQFVDFEDGSDGNDVSWRIKGEYSPLSFSRFSFASGRYVLQNNNEAQQYIISDSHRLGWQHQLTDTFSLHLATSYINEEQHYFDEQEEETYWLNEAALSWRANQQIAYKVRYLYNDLDSDLDNVSNDQQQLILEMSVVF